MTFRSEAYRRAVSSLPCARCGLERHSQAAHSNHFGKGMALKAEDVYLFPLCIDRIGLPGCHTRHDQLIDYGSDEAIEREKDWIITTLAELLRRKIFIVDMRKIEKT